MKQNGFLQAKKMIFTGAIKIIAKMRSSGAPVETMVG